MKDDVFTLIETANMVTAQVRKEYFLGKDFLYIRKWLEEHGYDRHMVIELNSCEIAVITPKGLMMQIRPCDAYQLGFWGGTIKDGETTVGGAIRELREELQIEVKPEDLKYVGYSDKRHCYQNGDQALFHASRFVLKLDYIPQVYLDEESSGAVFLRPILSHQRSFVEECLNKYF